MTALLERVALNELRDLLAVGWPLPFRILDGQGRLLLNAGQTIVDEDRFQSLIERGAWAERPAVQVERAIQAAAAAQVNAHDAPSLFDHWQRLFKELETLTRALTRREARASEVSAFVPALRSLVEADPDVAVFLCIRQDHPDFSLYPLTHALHCAALALLAGQHLAWSNEKIDVLVCAALTMNVSILELQAVMAKQSEPPNARQLREIRAHPELSVAMLRACGVTDERWLMAVGEHHESSGGGGYPHGANSVGELAVALRAIDIFMAKISPRASRPPMTPQTAISHLFRDAPNDPLTMALIRTLGLHPPGSLLKLRSGEVGVSIRRLHRIVQPLVATLSDVSGRPITQTYQRDTSEPEFAVVGPLANTNGFARVPPERVYGLIPDVSASRFMSQDGSKPFKAAALTAEDSITAVTDEKKDIQ